MANYNKDDLRREIRKLRGLFYTHQQIIDTLHIPERSYFYHWGIIKQENSKIYDKLTEENIREDVERSISGLQHNIQRLQKIIDDSKDDELVSRAIETQSQLMAAIPKQRQQGESFIDKIGLEYTNRGKPEENKQAGAASTLIKQ